jgi:hypothetical protein
MFDGRRGELRHGRIRCPQQPAFFVCTGVAVICLAISAAVPVWLAQPGRAVVHGFVQACDPAAPRPEPGSESTPLFVLGGGSNRAVLAVLTQRALATALSHPQDVLRGAAGDCGGRDDACAARPAHVPEARPRHGRGRPAQEAARGCDMEPAQVAEWRTTLLTTNVGCAAAALMALVAALMIR